MIKLIGAILVLVSCTALGIKSVAKNRERLTALKELRDTLIEISRGIGFQLEPLPELVKRLSREADAGDSFLRRLTATAEKAPASSFSEHWHSTLSAYAKDKQLPNEAVQMVQALGAVIGKMDRETEQERLNMTSEGLTALLTEEESQSAKTEKMVKSLGIILGIFIVIIFV